MTSHGTTRLGLAAAMALAAGAAGADTIFLSARLRPIEEATAVRQDILKGVEGSNTWWRNPPSSP